MTNPIQTFSREELPFVKQLVQVKTITIDATALDAGHTGNTGLPRNRENKEVHRRPGQPEELQNNACR